MKLPFVPNPWVILGVVLAVGGAFGGGYWRGGVAKENAIKADEADDKQVARDAADAVADKVAEFIAQHRGKTSIINNKAVETVKENTIFSQCLEPEDMQELIRQARQP